MGLFLPETNFTNLKHGYLSFTGTVQQSEQQRAFRPEVIAVLFKAHSNGRGNNISKFIILITIVTLLLSDGVWRPPPTTVECFHHCDRQLPFLLSSPSPAQFVDLCTNNFSFSICPVRDIICWYQVCDIYIYIHISQHPNSASSMLFWPFC